MQSSIIMVLTSYSWLQTQNNEIESHEAAEMQDKLSAATIHKNRISSTTSLVRMFETHMRGPNRINHPRFR